MSSGRYTLTWTAPAEEDLLAIVQFIKQDDPAAARIFAKQIKKKVTRLRSFPYSGRIVPEFSIRSLREIILRDYRIVYRVLPRRQRVEILTIFHGAHEFPF